MTSAIRSLGKAYVELHGDYSKLGPEAERAIKAEVDKATDKITFDELAEKAGQSGRKAGRDFGEHFVRDASGRLRDLRGRFVREADALAATFERSLTGGGGGGGFGFRIRNFFNSVRESISDFAEGVSDKFKSVSNFVSSVGSAFSTLGSIIYAVVIVAAIPAIFGLAGALFNLIGIVGLLPATFGAAVVAIAPLVLAFQGLGDALSAGLAGDTEKFNEALKKLAPSARAVVKEIVALKKPFDALKSSVQQAFFQPLIGTFNRLARTIFPVLTPGLTKIASALGNVAKTVSFAFSDPDGLDAIRAVLDATLHIVQRLEPSLTSFLIAMGDASRAAAPFVERLFFGLLDALTDFSTFISEAVESGKFTEFLERAFTIGKDLFKILGATGRLISTLFGGGNVFEGSSDFLNDIATAINKLADFFASPDGQQAIEGMLEILKTLGIVLIATAIGFGKFIHFADEFGRALVTAGKAVVAFFGAVGRFVVDAGKAIGDFFAGIGSAVADFFTNTIPEAFDKVVEFFQGLPDRAVEAGGSLKDKLITWATDALVGLREAVLVHIGRIIGEFLALPFLIPNALRELRGVIVHLFTEAFDAVVTTLHSWADTILAFLFSLPGRATSALTSFRDLIVNAFREGLDRAVNFVRDGLDKISNFIGSLPGRISALGPALLNAARNLGHKIGDGLAEIGNFASDIGKRIVNTVRGGINSIIDGINRGIADIDAKIPIGLPRLPHLAKGAIINDPTVALVGEAGPEVVVPLSDPDRARQLADESGLTAILNQVSATPIVHVTAILDGFGVMKIVKTVVDSKFDQQGQELAFGART